MILLYQSQYDMPMIARDTSNRVDGVEVFSSQKPSNKNAIVHSQQQSSNSNSPQAIKSLKKALR